MRRIMYVENKSSGEGRIGWVEMTRTHRTYRYDGRSLLKTKSGYKYNCIDVDTKEHFWVSGPKKNGQDRLYGGVVEIDEDAREEYWSEIRNRPECIELTRFKI